MKLTKIDEARRWLEGTLVWTIWARMLEAEFVDRSIALAGKAFVSFFPLVIVIAAFVPQSLRQSIMTTLTHRLGITGPSLHEVTAAFANPSQIREATGILGLILTFFFANSFTTALQRVYLRIWRRPSASGLLTYARGFGWLVLYLGYMAALGALRRVLNGGGLGIVGFSLLALVLSVAMWTFTAWVMLMTQVRFRVLLATGLATSLTVFIYTVAAPYWMPGQISSNQQQFGFFGIALSLITWLSGAAVCILLSVAAGAVLVEGDGRIARVLRFGAPTTLIDGAAPPLPAPVRSRNIKDVLAPLDIEEA